MNQLDDNGLKKRYPVSVLISQRTLLRIRSPTLQDSLAIYQGSRTFIIERKTNLKITIKIKNNTKKHTIPFRSTILQARARLEEPSTFTISGWPSLKRVFNVRSRFSVSSIDGWTFKPVEASLNGIFCQFRATFIYNLMPHIYLAKDKSPAPKPQTRCYDKTPRSQV